MKVFVTGATGFVGSAIVRELLNAGHQVLALVRSKENARAVIALGAEAHEGNLNDLNSLRKGAENSDGIIHTAFNHDFSKFKESSENDRRIIEMFGDVFAKDQRPLIITSAIGLLPRGRVVNESGQAIAGANPRIASEQAADTVADKGVRISVIRLSPSVHGEGDHGFIPMLINIAKQKGISVYQDDGMNYWPAVHRKDAAILYRLALEKAASPGIRYHGVAEEGIPFKEIAITIAKGLKINAVSKDKDAAAAHFGSFAHFAAMDIRASSQQTRLTLNWQPVQPDLLTELSSGVYFS